MAGVTATYISSVSFSITGDQTSIFNEGRRVRATCSSVYKYGTIESSTYSSLTTVVLTATSDALNNGLTSVHYGIQADSVGSLPTHSHDTTEGEGGTVSLINLSDTPAAYDSGKVLKSTTSGTEWSADLNITNHSELNELDYASAGHTGFAPTSHSHTESDISDLDKYTEAEVDTISGSLNTKISGKSDTGHTHDDRYYTESEVDTISGSLNTKISGKADTSHSHTESDISDLDKYTQSEVDTISGSLQTNIDGKSDTGHIHDDRYYTETEVDDLITTISGKLDDHNELNNLDYASSGHTGFQPAGDYATDSELTSVSGALQTNIDGKADTVHTHDDRYYTESETDTISGSLQTNIDGKSDTSHIHDDRYYTETEVDALIATISGGTSNHDELNNLDYASSGHTGFQPAGDYATTSDLTSVSGVLQTNIDGKSDTGHTHDDRYYTESEVDTISGSLQTNIDGKSDTGHTHDDRYYTESEVDTISGSLQSNIDGDKPASEIIVSTINSPTYNDIQDWINNTQSSGRMSDASTTAHTDAITGVTVSGAGHGEFKISGDQTSCYVVAESILVDESTNNDGYYTIASGVAYADGTTTIPVEETVSSGIDGIIYNGTVDVSDGTGFIKKTDSDIGETVSFDIHADTNIELTDVITNYLYVDYNGGTPDIKVTTDRSSIEHNRQFFLSMVYRNGPRIWSCSCGVYLPNFLVGNHERLIIARGYERGSGGEVSEYGTRNIQTTAGIFFRGATRVDTTAKASATDKLTTVYYDGSDWVWTEDEAQVDNTYWNNTATGLVELSNGRYAVHWVCIDYLSNIYVVYGRGDYTLPQAQLAGVPSLVPVVAYEFGIIAAKIIIQKSASSISELLSAYTQVIPSETPTVHNDLSGLNNGDYKHLTSDNHIDLTDGNDCSIHKHDDLYYTESEVDTISGSLQTNIDGKSATGHTHDDRYYTESEIDTISGSLSTEIDSDISTHASNADAHHNESHTVVSHSDTTATGANLNELVGAGDTVLHKHDGLYYTESEVDTISGSINTNIDNKYDDAIDYAKYKSTGSFLSKDLLVYYGYTNSFNYGDNAWTNELVARDMARYNMVVFGNGIADPGHGDYANFLIVAARLKVLKPGIKLFGYVSGDQAIAAFSAEVDEWDDVSQIDGIFIDEVGYDFGVTRSGLNAEIDYIHSLDCDICFVNAWTMNHVIGIENDASYPNSTWNPGLDASSLTTDDWCLLESFSCNTTSYSATNGYAPMATWLVRGNNATANRNEFGINIACVSVISKDDADAATLFEFHYLSAIMFSLDAQGSSDTSYAASSAIVPFYKRDNWLGYNMGLTYDVKATAVVATDNWQIHYRYTNKGKMICDHTDTDPVITCGNNIDGYVIIADSSGSNWRITVTVSGVLSAEAV